MGGEWKRDEVGKRVERRGSRNIMGKIGSREEAVWETESMVGRRRRDEGE